MGKQFPEGEEGLVGTAQNLRVFISTGFYNIEPMFLYIRNDHDKYLLLLFMSLADTV